MARALGWRPAGISSRTARFPSVTRLWYGARPKRGKSISHRTPKNVETIVAIMVKTKTTMAAGGNAAGGGPPTSRRYRCGVITARKRPKTKPPMAPARALSQSPLLALPRRDVGHDPREECVKQSETGEGHGHHAELDPRRAVAAPIERHIVALE